MLTSLTRLGLILIRLAVHFANKLQTFCSQDLALELKTIMVISKVKINS